MNRLALAASGALLGAAISAACGDGGGQTPIGGPYGGTGPYTGPNGGNEGTGASAGTGGSGGADGTGGSGGVAGSSGSSGFGGSSGSSGSGGASGVGGSSGSGGAAGAGGSSGSGGASGSSGSGGSGGSSGHDAGPPDTGSTAATWTEVWTNYLSPSASTGCTGSCHYHSSEGAGTAAGTCTWLTKKGQITGSPNPPLTNTSSSDLTWFGGFMPKDGPSSDPAAVTAFNAWSAAGGKCP
jgi:hypothetical protein